MLFLLRSKGFTETRVHDTKQMCGEMGWYRSENKYANKIMLILFRNSELGFGKKENNAMNFTNKLQHLDR